MANTLFKTYTNEHGGRAILLFLLFGLSIYQFIHAGFPVFAIICLSPLLVLAVYVLFSYKTTAFWALIFINYFVQFFDKQRLLPSGIPMSMYNELLEILFERTANFMLLTLMVWCGFCTLEVLNNTCGLGINVGAWYQGARLMAFQILYAFLVFSIYIDTPNMLVKYLFFWACICLFSVFWVWKQQYIGFTATENAWLQGRARATHVLQGGTLIRYFSTYSDAANFGIGIASAAIAFLIFGITAKIKKFKRFFLIAGLACTWAMFPSGTRTAMACLMAGILVYVFLSKSVKIATFVSIFGGIAFFILAFTNIGQGNQQIRRMRSMFDKSDASSNVRTINQRTMKKYMAEAPWGIGLGMGMNQVPANNKYAIMSVIPADSEYVFIWLLFLILTALMFAGACVIVLFRLNSRSLRGIGAGLCSAFVSIQLGAYGNEVLMQFPNCLVFYGGLSIVYLLPHLEKEWIEYENGQLAIEAEKKRLKLEKKLASRV